MLLPTVCGGAGNLALTLDANPEQSCFAAEGYANELGVADATEDSKVSYALLMLRALFSKWAVSRGLPREHAIEAAATPRCAPSAKRTIHRGGGAVREEGEWGAKGLTWHIW